MNTRSTHTALTANTPRPIVRLAQIQERAGVSDESNTITKEQKMALAEAGTPFVITAMEQEEGENGLFWVFHIELEGDERVFFMGENAGNEALFAAMHAAITDEGAAIGPMRLQYIPPRTTRKGERRYGFYKLTEVEEDAIDGFSRQVSAALATTQKQLADINDVLPF